MNSETITKADLTDLIYEKVGISYLKSNEIIKSVFEEIAEALKTESAVKIPSFGSFYVKRKKQRVGRNPKTKIKAMISERNVIGFYASTKLKRRMNEEK